MVVEEVESAAAAAAMGMGKCVGGRRQAAALTCGSGRWFRPTTWFHSQPWRRGQETDLPQLTRSQPAGQ